MNLDDIKKDISSHIGCKVRLEIYGMRNKKDVETGLIDEVYPNLFVVKTNRGVKSINYCDVATKEVIVKYM